jgi:hypothetical protein
MKNNVLTASLVLAVLLALGITLRITFKNNDFNDLVTASLKKTEGYDKKFLELVNRMEELLASRASFGYTGGKDPMTGKVRKVVISPPKGKWAKRVSKTKKKAVADPVKLTAIIEDDFGKHTAIVMDGDRSLSVSVGDRVGKRKVTAITKAAIFMEDDKMYFTYDISGKKYQKKK